MGKVLFSQVSVCSHFEGEGWYPHPANRGEGTPIWLMGGTPIQMTEGTPGSGVDGVNPIGTGWDTPPPSWTGWVSSLLSGLEGGDP